MGQLDGLLFHASLPGRIRFQFDKSFLSVRVLVLEEMLLFWRHCQSQLEIELANEPIVTVAADANSNRQTNRE